MKNHGSQGTQQLISGILGVMGIWLILRHIPDLVSSVYIALTEEEHLPNTLLFVQFFHFAVAAFLGIAVVFTRQKIATWLSGSNAEVSIHAPSLLAVGSVILGLYFAAIGIISIAEQAGIAAGSTRQNNFLLYKGLTSITIGIVLMVCSVGISRVWSKLKGLQRAGV